MNARAVRALAALLLLSGAVPALAQAPPAGAGRSASLPRWDGVWVAENQSAEISGVLSIGPLDGVLVQKVYPLAGFAAPWNETGWRRFEAMLAGAVNSKADGWGYPMMMNSPAPLQFVITPHETLIMNIYREIRYIYTDGRPHPPAEDRWPTTWGDSVGRWEGDTLVVDTIGAHEPLHFAMFAPPLSEQAHYVERLRMTAPGRIESDITITDPVTLAEPWHIKMAYRRSEGMDRIVYEALDNDRTGDDGELYTIEPAAKPKPTPAAAAGPAEVKLTAAEMDRVVGRYQLAPGEVLTVRRQGNLLLAGTTSQPTLPLHAEAPLTFFMRSFILVKVRFTADATGTASDVTVEPAGLPASTGKRLPAS